VAPLILTRFLDSARRERQVALGAVLPEDAAMRIGYIWSRPIPSRDTDTQQMMKTVDALGAEGADVELILPESSAMRRNGLQNFEAELRAFYALRSPFRLRAIRGVPATRIELERPVHALLSCLWLQPERYDVVYTRSRSAALLCALRGGPVVFETYRMLGKEHPFLVSAYAKLAAEPRLLGIVTHSHVSRASIERRGFPPHKIATIHNGFDPEDLLPRMTHAEARSELGLDRNKPIVCYTGHVRARKGIDALLDTAALTPQVDYLIAGGHADDIVTLEAECRRRGLSNVRCLGWRPAAALRPLLYAADVLVIPPSKAPLQEHGRTVLPMKVFSYLAAGRAILAPALPDLEEVLEHGKNAWLVPPDDARAAADAVLKLTSEPELAAALGASAQQSSEGLSWRARARKLIAQIEAWQALG
jgi:glycosyltransferase involved in cell wall biosynthesis